MLRNLVRREDYSVPDSVIYLDSELMLEPLEDATLASSPPAFWTAWS